MPNESEEFERLKDEAGKILALLRLFDRLDVDLQNRDDQRSLLDALRLLRRVRQTPNIELQLAMLAEQYERRDKTRIEARNTGWHILRTLTAEAAKWLTMAGAGAVAVWMSLRGGP